MIYVGFQLVQIISADSLVTYDIYNESILSVLFLNGGLKTPDD